MTKDWRGSTEQLEAIKVMCPFCKAPVDSPCVNEGRVLRAFPAHEVRSRAARQVLDSINTRRKP